MRVVGSQRVTAACCALVLVIASSGLFEDRFAAPTGGVANWWPAAGLAVAVLSLVPGDQVRAWTAAIAVAATLANLGSGREAPLAVVYGVADALEALLVVRVLRARTRDGRLDSVRDYFVLVGACLVGIVGVGVGVGLVTAAASSARPDGVLVTGLAVVPSHLASMLVILPGLMVACGSRSTPARRPELVVQLGALLLSTLWAYGPGQPLALVFLVQPVLLWGALRFEGACQIFCVSDRSI